MQFSYKSQSVEELARGAKPFVKWVGGKTQLLSDIEHRLPKNFRTRKITYVEPFVGGGAVLFWLLEHYPNVERAVINDINPRLVNVYRTIKETPSELIEALRLLEQNYLPKSHEERTAYYLERRKEFNENFLSPVQQAALFIFLNRTCFNGLYRENAKGYFNVPHGRYARPTICDEKTIRANSAVLQRVEILCGDFAQTLPYATPDTLFYFDPPYKPLSDTSSFNSYVKEPFDDKEQIRLRDFCRSVVERGAQFILSNSDVKGKNPEDNFFDDLYADYDIRRVLATRLVNAKADKRGKLTELMISSRD